MTELEQRAKKSVAAFRAMIPSLNGYAQAITGRKSVQVVPATGAPRTDGKTIFFPPPIGLGDNTPHVRSACDKRDPETMFLVCPACNMRERVLSSLYHEISHIIFGTTEKFQTRRIEAALVAGLDMLPPEWKKVVTERLARQRGLTEPMLAAQVVSPFLPVLVNALEDVRVDTAMFRERRGVRAMWIAKINRVLIEGIEDTDGTVVKWNTRSLDAQAMVATLLVGMGTDAREYFVEEIGVVFADSELGRLMQTVPSARDAIETLESSFAVFARLRELGFLNHPSDPQPEPEPKEEDEDGEPDDAPTESPEDSEDEADASMPAGGDPADDSGDGDDDSGGDGEPGSDGSESHDSGESDPESDEAEPEADGGEGESDADGGSGDPDSGEDEGGAGHEALPGDEDGESGDSSAGDSGSEPAGQEEELNDGETDGSGGSDHQEQLGEDDGDDSGEDADRGGVGGEPREDEGDGPVGSAGRPADDADLSAGDGEAPADDPESALDDSGGSGDPAPWDESPNGDDVRSHTVVEPVYCDPDEVDRDIRVLTGHLEEEVEQTREETEMVAAYVLQGDYFESPSTNITGVRVHKWGEPTIYQGRRSQQDGWSQYTNDKEVPSVGEPILGPALLEMRRTFQDNARADHQRHLRSGRVDARVLGKRAWAKDDRLFQKKRLPGKRDYAVLLGLDISGSTHGANIHLIKRAAAAQAELCDRLGVDFSIFAHTANPDPGRGYHQGLGLDLYEVKKFGAPWSAEPKAALAGLCADAENLDGHTIEFYRKMIEKHPATDKIILYYTDGKMPAANHDEELEILQREIRVCKQKGITLMGVGIRTSSPKAHGLDTVRVDADQDMVKVVRHLESALVRGR